MTAVKKAKSYLSRCHCEITSNYMKTNSELFKLNPVTNRAVFTQTGKNQQ